MSNVDLKALSDTDLEAERLRREAIYEQARADLKAVVAERNTRATDKAARSKLAGMSPAEREAMRAALGEQTISLAPLKVSAKPSPVGT